VITLSAGTPYKPPPLDPHGHPIFEAVAAAKYLVERGLDRAKVLVEACSYDTIGNAYFSRVIHTGPRGLRRLLLITSEFHMLRAEAVFRWIYGLHPLSQPYALDFLPVENVGLSPDVLRARREKEQAALANLQEKIRSCHSLERFHEWLFSEHQIYAVPKWSAPWEPVKGPLLQTY